jgi:penicillin amidase
LTWLKRILLGTLMVLGAALAGGWWWLQGSLAQLDGQRLEAGLDAPVSLQRDAQGLLTISGSSRADIAFALGFAHAQDRFFQMDLQRRSAAGELAALVGAAALPMDQRVRIHRFRARAQQALAAMPAEHSSILQRYSDGANAGLSALRSRPFEYALLRSAPQPWQPEDCVLSVYSMFLTLQDEQARFERGMGLMVATLPSDMFAFFTQQGGQWDAPLEGEPLPPAALPFSGFAQLPGPALAVRYNPLAGADLVPGSNNWAVAGNLTAHGSAIVANDMHLPIRVPNIWYRANWQHPDTGRQVSGVTLPGMPALVAGSNGSLAWGFTNTQGDWSDVVVLETSADGSRYATAQGERAFTEHQETIEVKGQPSQTLTVQETIWGPVIGRNHRGQQLALRWVAHDPQAANAQYLAMETYTTVLELIEAAPGFGMPHQNLVAGDSAGNIGWTIAGPIPLRVGLDGRVPSAWHVADTGWQGYHGPDTHPRIINPTTGRLWTANARVLSGDGLQVMGSEGSALGARQQQIRDRLLAADAFDEQAMLDIALDDEALFLARWRERLLAVLSTAGATGEPALDEARQLLHDWSGRAFSGDVGYRLVREFRLATFERVLAPLETYLQSRDPSFSLRAVSRQMEYPVWTLLEEQPGHLLNPDFDSWQALELAAIRAVVAPLIDDGSLANDSWGEANRLAIRHPLASAVPALQGWLSMPDTAMSGDTHLPRVQAPVFGASERFAVAPGREQDGFLHMATGQSSHPLSPFYRAGHDDWVEGRFSPFNPGPGQHQLQLLPAR